MKILFLPFTCEDIGVAMVTTIIFLFFIRILTFWNRKYNVAKYHLGKVKLERVGQQSSPTSVCDLRGGPWGIAGLLVCPFASVALHCSFAC